MAITAAGVGSGLDIENLVSQLMTLERRPLELLQQKATKTQTEISAFGSLKSALSSFQAAMEDLSTLDAFKKFTTTSSDDEVMKATADGNAAAGLYSVEVTRLAQNFKQGSKEIADGTLIGGGSGDSLTLTVDGASLTVDLSTAMGLADLRDAINADADNPGVVATILNTGDGNQRLILTAEDSGYAKRFEVSYGGAINASTFDFETINKNSQNATMTDLTELDGLYSIDGYELTATSNSLTGVIDGITLELEGVGSAQLELQRDTAAIEESAQKFVDEYNKVLSLISSLRNNEDITNSSVFSSITRTMRDVLNTAPAGLTGTYNALSQVGIKTNADTGQLEFSSTDFTTALDTDFTAVAQVFANDDQGFAFRFDALMGTFLEDDGLIDARLDSLSDRVDDIEDDELALERRLELKEASLRAQFAALDTLLGSLQSTSQFLSNNFSSV